MSLIAKKKRLMSMVMEMVVVRCYVSNPDFDLPDAITSIVEPIPKKMLGNIADAEDEKEAIIAFAKAVHELSYQLMVQLGAVPQAQENPPGEKELRVLQWREATDVLGNSQHRLYVNDVHVETIFIVYRGRLTMLGVGRQEVHSRTFVQSKEIGGEQLALINPPQVYHPLVHLVFLTKVLTERMGEWMAFPNPNCEAGLEVIMREQKKMEARKTLSEEIAGKDAEIARLKCGDFTPEELQGLCHNLSEKPECRMAFCDGCAEYQHKLFGESEREQLRGEIAQLKTECENLALYKKLHEHAIRCVDDVFQEYSGHVPILPGFLMAGDDKFEGVIKLANEYVRLKAELAAARPAPPKVEWVQTVISLIKSSNDERLNQMDEWRREADKWKSEGDWCGWNFFQGMAAGANWIDIIYYRVRKAIEQIDLAAAKAAVESALAPVGVRRWVSHHGNNKVVTLHNEKPKLDSDAKWFIGGYGGYMTLEVAAAIGVNLEPGQACLYDFTYRRVVERWEP